MARGPWHVTCRTGSAVGRRSRVGGLRIGARAVPLLIVIIGLLVRREVNVVEVYDVWQLRGDLSTQRSQAAVSVGDRYASQRRPYLYSSSGRSSIA
jgi:hypothetical protein